MRKIASLTAAGAMLFSTAAFAADAPEQGALAPGNAASIHQAQGMDSQIGIIVLGGIVVAAGVALLVTGNSNTNATTGTIAAPPS